MVIMANRLSFFIAILLRKEYNKNENGYYKNIIEGRKRKMLYDYLVKTYGKNEPILVSEIEIEGLSDNTLRQQIKKLVDSGKLKRFDTGVYFIPKESVFKSGATISATQVIEKKYLKDKDGICGYLSGYLFVNRMRLTTQVPAVYEVVSNKASNEYRKITVGNIEVILRKPRIEITGENAKVLQFLDLIKDVDLYAELEGEELKRRILAYMKAMNFTFSMFEPYLSYYPDKIYKNLYEVGVLTGVSA